MHKLAEKEALVDETCGPLQVKQANALAYGEVTAVCEEQR